MTYPIDCLQPIKILIADDSAPVRERLFSLLEDLPGVQVVGQAENAPQAVDLARRWLPHLITLDIQMPGVAGLKNGIDVVRKIKQEQPLVLVVMLTNLVENPYRTKCLEAGADYFFDKSSQFDCIAPVVRQVLPCAPFSQPT